MTWEAAREAWRGIPGITSESAPTSFDSLRADDVSPLVDWLDGAADSPSTAPAGEPETLESGARDPEDVQLWADVLREVEKRLPAPTFKSKLVDTEVWGRAGDLFVVLAETTAQATWIDKNAAGLIQTTLLDVSGGEKLDFQIRVKS